MKASSKRRRTKAELKRAAQEELEQENTTRAKFARLSQVEHQLEEASQQAAVNHDAAVLMSDLVNAGVIEEKGPGSFIVNGAQGKIEFDYNK